MPYRTTRTNYCKILSPPLTWPRARLSAIAGWLFAATDAEAAGHGWQVTVTHGGRGRKYRDPRFDALTACPDCSGDGTRAGDSRAPCRRCRGTGRICTDPALAAVMDRPAGGMADGTTDGMTDGMTGGAR